MNHDTFEPTGWEEFVNEYRKKMTDIIDTIELKNAEVVANVGDKQISAKVEDKAAAENRAEQAQEVLPV